MATAVKRHLPFGKVQRQNEVSMMTSTVAFLAMAAIAWLAYRQQNQAKPIRIKTREEEMRKHLPRR